MFEKIVSFIYILVKLCRKCTDQQDDDAEVKNENYATGSITSWAVPSLDRSKMKHNVYAKYYWAVDVK